MTTDYSFEENIKDFNRMFNDLDPDHFDRFTYLMAEAVVKKVEVVDEIAKRVKKYSQDSQNTPLGGGRDRVVGIGNRHRDVQIWCKERLYQNQ